VFTATKTWHLLLILQYNHVQEFRIVTQMICCGSLSHVMGTGHTAWPQNALAISISPLLCAGQQHYRKN
jgi:hypothetical protein